MQTFRIIDTDEAQAEIREMGQLGTLTELPEITEHHPIMADGDGGAVLCAHDTANGASRIFQIPVELTAALAADEPEVEVFHERISAHLNRLARAVYN